MKRLRLAIVGIALLASCRLQTPTDMSENPTNKPTKILTLKESMKFLTLSDVAGTHFTDADKSGIVDHKEVIRALGDIGLSAAATSDQTYIIVGDYYVPSSVYNTFSQYTPYYLTEDVMNILTPQDRDELFAMSTDELKNVLSSVGITTEAIRAITYQDHYIDVNDVSYLINNASVESMSAASIAKSRLAKEWEQRLKSYDELRHQQ